MPPKAKKGAKKGGKKGDAKKTPPATAGEGDDAGTLEELRAHFRDVKESLKKEQEERNYFQLERDKINTFWEITKRELEERKAELRNKDREMEEMEERHQVEIKVYKQKVKHLLYEHQNNITQLKTDGETALKLQLDEFRVRETELKKEKRDLKVEMKTMELHHEDAIRSLKEDHERNVTKLRQEYKSLAEELQQNYEKKMKQLREELETRRKMEIHEIEERKNAHINELMKKHEKAFGEIKNYYNDITHNNLDLIKSLKEELAEAKKKEAQNEKILNEVVQENKRLSEPLTRALKDVETLRAELDNYHKDKLSLQNAKSRVMVLEEQLKSLQWEHEVLEQRFEQVQQERDELYERFESTIYEVQQKSGLKTLMLEKKVEAMGEQLEKKEAQLAEVLAASNLDPAKLGALTKKLEEVMDAKNQMIRDLRYELARVTKAHNDVIRVYESKLASYGIPVEELGFRPLATKTGTAPAGLVAAQP
uniref:Growth arrest-specific protein 8 domain-containing protein n=1 Tax=Palpitomonas bilix TaxID=652834 RepID=A0A7S3DIN4_9EUKA|mmetsp:Transcript_39187/g.100402  ORF Transcript_39187/g.100402 Transcript_39187/m.100402 type:complete len:481 (+) Transcript_39187:109-1551(+)|eukprot:CAMPEP_0113867026 /NCGR_PEP_ID=MMETSP0780_2-20120614/194_1 /TAXON_ID=652834 /ORGANISM="Palpitomonas bilix" /LENGTH=480 /DNA_ID=CAMNT_0000851931 /DNA_START=56 /DNA_END=1498 /DNA_ORIENTATION=- /assembly_acc=CAM_ASM_000599